MTFAVTKDPNATLDYVVEWEHYLDSDTIDSVEWITPDGITADATSNTTTAATAWLSGGTLGIRYDVVCRITTVAGRVDDRTVRVAVVDK